MKKKMTLKTLLKAFSISSLVFSIPACSINIENIEINEKTPTLSFAQASVTTAVGESFRLDPVIANLEGTDLVNYSFDKEGYISFENGEFKALREGDVVINASLKGYADVKATVSVKINPASQVSGVKIAASYQGSYVFDKQEIIIHESSIEILENGASVTLDIKQDANGYYFETGSDRLSISFEADDKVKIDNTVFSRKNGNTNQDKYTKASIPDTLLGQYSAYGFNLTVNRDNLELVSEGMTLRYWVYTENNAYFIVVQDGAGNDVKTMITFGDDSISFEGTTYTRNGQTQQHVIAHLPDALQGYYYKGNELLAVYESKLVTSDGNQYPIYYDEESKSYFYLLDTRRIGLEFSEDKLVTTFGEYLKKNSSTVEEHVIAHLPGGYIGSYGDEEGIYVELRESSVLVREDGKELLFDLYVDDDGQYYIIDGTEIVYCYLELDVCVRNKYGTFYKIGYQGDTYDLAHLPNLYQGTYTSNKIVVQVLESSVIVIENGKSYTYSLYIEGNSYFVVDEGRRIYCTFSADGSSVTNDFGTFTKQQTPTYDIAHLPSMLQGEYFSGSITVKVFESKVVVMEEQKTNSYDLYFDGTNYFVVEEGRKVYCTFSDDGSSVTNDFGTFTKKGGQENPSQVAVPKNYQGQYKSNDDTMFIYVSESAIILTFTDGNQSASYTYEIFQDDKGYYVLTPEEQERADIKFENGCLVVGNESYQKISAGLPEYDKASLPKTYQGAFYGYLNGMVINAQVSEDTIGIYFGEEQGLSFEVYQYTNEGAIEYYALYESAYFGLSINENEFSIPTIFEDIKFTRDLPSDGGDVVDEAYQGSYYAYASEDQTINIEIDGSSLHLFANGLELVYPLNIDDDGHYYFLYDGEQEYIYLTADGLQVGDLLFTKKNQGGQGQHSNLPEEYLGEYYTEGKSAIVYDSYISLISAYGSVEKADLILSADKIYYIESNGSYLTVEFISGYYLVIGNDFYTRDTSDLPSVVPEYYQGSYFAGELEIVINSNNLQLISEELSGTYIIISKDGKYYLVFDGEIEMIFTDEAVQIGDELYVREDEEEIDPDQTYFEGKGWPQEYLSKEYPGLRISQIPSRNATYMYEYSVGEYFNIGYEGVTEQEFASWVTSLQRSNFKLIEEGYFTCLVASGNYYIEMFCDEDSLTITKYEYEGDETSFPSEAIKRIVGDLGIPELQAASYLTYLEEGISIIAFGVEQETFENYVISLQRNESFELVEHEEESLEYYYSVGNCAMYLGYESTSYIATLLIYPEE